MATKLREAINSLNERVYKPQDWKDLAAYVKGSKLGDRAKKVLADNLASLFASDDPSFQRLPFLKEIGVRP